MAASNQPGTQPDKASYDGPRKLVRPQLAQYERRRELPQTEDPLSHAMISDTHGVPESSHAEVFYFQKQMQQETQMTIVLDDGEELHGIVQWFDKCVIKLRVGRQRILIYKSCIKYLYKGSEAHPANVIMK